MNINLPKYLCVLDFEATCDEDHKIKNEIIEFPSVLLEWNEDKKNYVKVSEFQEYCKPQHSPILSNFCIELTGITQDKIDTGSRFPDTLNNHHEWLKTYVESDDDVMIVTCGFWDLNVMFPDEWKKWDELENKVPPIFYKRFANIKKEYQWLYKLKKNVGMFMMLKFKDMELVGRHHSGIDDCRNIARIFQRLVDDGLDKLTINTLPDKRYRRKRKKTKPKKN